MVVSALRPTSVDPSENPLINTRVWFQTPVQLAPGLVVSRGVRVVWRDDGMAYKGRVIAASPQYGKPHYFLACARVWLMQGFEVIAYASELEKVE